MSILIFFLLVFQGMGTITAQEESNKVPKVIENSSEVEQAVHMDLNNVMSLNFHRSLISEASLKALEPVTDKPVSIHFNLSSLPTKPLMLQKGQSDFDIDLPVEGRLSIVDQQGQVHFRRFLEMAKSGYRINYPKKEGKLLVQLIGEDGYLYEHVLEF